MRHADDHGLDRYAPYALAVLRIVTALIFMEHGTQKLFGFPAAAEGGGQPALLSLRGIGGVMEFVGGIFILLGLFTRPVAFLLSGEMAVAYWMFHAPRAFYPVLNGGDAAILYCFVFLLFVFTGPGAWSLDGARPDASRRATARIGRGAGTVTAGVTWTTAALGWFFAAYALLTAVYIVLENRRPQATFAWMLLFLAVPGLGLLVYVLFGRDRKAFSRRRALARQDLEANAAPLLDPVLARQDAEIDRLEGQSPLRGRLMQLVRRNSHSILTARNRVAVQQDASAHYPSLAADLEGARRSIHLQYYIWADDPFTRGLKAILLERAAAGVEVRLLYDPVGCLLRLTRRYKRELRAGGVRVAPVSPLWRLHTISYRNHRKIAVVDGRVGYTGGMNVGQEHLDGGPTFPSWRDTQVRIEGEGVAALQAVFLVDWRNATGEDLFAPDRFPPLRAEVQQALGAKGATTGAVPPGAGDGAGEVPVQILTSGPDSQWRAIRQLYFAMIVSARRRVRLQSPFFVLEATLTEALASAALSGVDVQVMVSERGEGLNQAPYWAARTYMAEVAAAGVRLHLYGQGYLHAKTICVDGEVCSVGSANLDIRSFSINYELNAVIHDARLTGELEAAFERDLAACRPFDPIGYARGPALGRLRDSAARLLSPLL